MALQGEVKQYKSVCYAESTKATYRSCLHAYLRFCLYFGLQPVPATKETLLAYLAFLARSLKPSSIPTYLNVIRLMHLEVGLPNPLDDWEVSIVKKGILRTHGQPPKQKLPITPVVLKAMYNQLNLLDSLDRAFWCACLVGFYGYLRKSTLLPKTATQSTKHHLCCGDISWTDEKCFNVTVRHSKTIQFGQRELTIPMSGDGTSHLCPVKALMHMFDGLPPEPDRALFSYKDNNGVVKALDYGMFVKCLKLTLLKANYNPKDYSGHSLRRGGASFSFSIGLSPLIIKLRGDWKSNAYQKYIFVTDDYNQKAAKALSLAALSQ